MEGMQLEETRWDNVGKGYRLLHTSTLKRVGNIGELRDYGRLWNRKQFAACRWCYFLPKNCELVAAGRVGATNRTGHRSADLGWPRRLNVQEQGDFLPALKAALGRGCRGPHAERKIARSPIPAVSAGKGMGNGSEAEGKRVQEDVCGCCRLGFCGGGNVSRGKSGEESGQVSEVLLLRGNGRRDKGSDCDGT